MHERLLVTPLPTLALCALPVQVLNTVIPYPTAFRRVTREYVHRMRSA